MGHAAPDTDRHVGRDADHAYLERLPVGHPIGRLACTLVVLGHGGMHSVANRDIAPDAVHDVAKHVRPQGAPGEARQHPPLVPVQPDALDNPYVLVGVVTQEHGTAVG